MLKNMANSEVDQLLAGAFHAIIGKIGAGILQLQRSKIGNKFSCIKDTFSERFPP